MKKAMGQNLIREIRRSKTRFFSILSIALIGVAFFAGVRATGPDMKLSGDRYFDEYELFDLMAASPEGLTEEDLEDIRLTAGVSAVQGAVIQDAVVYYGGLHEALIKLYSLPIAEEAPGLEAKPAVFRRQGLDIDPSPGVWLNQPVLRQGRLPEADGEIALDNFFARDAAIRVGDTLTLENYGQSRRLTVTGLVDSPLYLYVGRGSSSLGSGTNQAFGLASGNDIAALGPKLPFGAELQRRYSAAYVKVNGAGELNSLLPEYERFVQPVKDRLKALGDQEDWLVLTRAEANDGYSGFNDDSRRIEAVGRVFPAIFFLVAILVTLATMTRMVEEQRIQIGTLKALGYGSGAIASGFLLYALAASLLGSLLGASIGFRLFPTVIFNAYSIIYTLPDFETPFYWSLALPAAAAAVGSVVFGTLAACLKELTALPAALMRHKAPPAGKRILLERLGFFWKQLSFVQKVTARNLFRYKKRFWMSVVGIAASCGLLLTGFGLRDSIFSIMDIEFDEIILYDLQCNLEQALSPGEMAEFIEKTLAPLPVEEALGCYFGNKDSRGPAEKEQGEPKRSVSVVASAEGEALGRMINMHDGDREIRLPREGAVISQKLSELMKAGPGDVFYITEGKSEREVKIADVMENYMNHYVLMSDTYYEEVFDESFRENHVLMILTGEGKKTQEETAAAILADQRVNLVKTASAIRNTLGDAFDSLYLVVVVLIFSAAALLFVIMYNLTNINIAERRRELATVKVLGFTDPETYDYVYRENYLLTLIGVILGMAAGVFMHRIVIVTCEIDVIKFVRQIKPFSYFLSAVFTFLFSFIVNKITRFQIRAVDMVESFKSVE